MKKIVIYIFIAVLLQNISFANRQHVHQRLVIEGYNLLKKWINNNTIPIMNDKIGDYSNIGNNPWEQGFLTTGAWREDVEDVVYRYSLNNPPAISGFTFNLIQALAWALGNDNNDGFVSSTHFWDADAGDDLATDMYGAFKPLLVWHNFQFTIPNAYQKMKHYANGDFDLRIQIMIRNFPNGNGVPCAAQWAWVNFRYGYLPTYFKNKTLRVSKIEWGDGSVTNYPNLPIFYEDHYYGLNAQSYTKFKDNICWEILGRMCHLLQDMGVPAHANVDPHGGGGLRYDSFENSFGDIGWTAEMVYNINQDILNPLICSNPIHFLMYTTQQQANHFASNGPHMRQRNDIFGGNHYPEEIAYLNTLNIPSYGEPIEMGENLAIENISNKMIPQMIRATAGLLYWFAMEADLLSNTLISNSFNGGNFLLNGSNNSSGHRLPAWNNPTSVNLQAIDQLHNNCYWRFQNWQKIQNGTVVQTYNTRNITITPTANTTYKANFTSENFFNFFVTGPTKGLYRGESRVFSIYPQYGNPPANYTWRTEFRYIVNGQVYWSDQFPEGCSINFYTNGGNSATLTNIHFSTYCSGWADSVMRVYGFAYSSNCGSPGQQFFEEITLKNRQRPGSPPPPPPPGGCPYVYTWNGSDWIEDNNILPQSQDPVLLGQEVTDYYQLYTKPAEEDGKYFLAISEYEEDKSYLNQIKLLVIDHPNETFVTVDDNGSVIQFAKPAIFADATLDSADVYKLLYSQDSLKTEVAPSDTLNLSFQDVPVGEEQWLLLVGQVKAVAKAKVSGKIIAETNDSKENSYSFSSFRLRRNPTYQWVVAPASNSSTLQIDIVWQEEAEVDYAELSNRLELPFTLCEAELLLAIHSNNGDITNELLEADELVSELNQDEWIELVFSIPEKTVDMQRSFIFVTKGRYERLSQKLNKPSSKEEEVILPSETKLYSNYPNPFNPSTMISYSLREEGNLSIKVYDILGSEVATLVNETKPAGTYEVEFNASQLPSGVYIYRMQAGSYIASKKMLLVK